MMNLYEKKPTQGYVSRKIHDDYNIDHENNLSLTNIRITIAFAISEHLLQNVQEMQLKR